MKHSIKVNIFFLLAVLIINACTAQVPTTATPEKQHTFELIIFEQVPNLTDDFYEDPAQSQLALKAADKKDALFVIGVGEIEEYNWNLQTITLTKNATEKLTTALANQKGTDSDELKKFKEMVKSVGLGSSLEVSLYIHPFVVKVDDQFKYGGMFLDAMSQRPINFPVIRTTNIKDKAAFAFLPIHLLFTMTDPIGNDGTLSKPTVNPFAKSDIEQLDIFQELSAQQANSDTSVVFRKVIRDEAIKRIFQLMGKLK